MEDPLWGVPLSGMNIFNLQRYDIFFNPQAHK